jgi:hypothetical protein
MKKLSQEQCSSVTRPSAVLRRTLRGIALRWLVACALVAACLVPLAPSPALAADPPADTPAVGVGPFGQGAVVALKGTPHIWVADQLGTLHWAADTRSLAGHIVDMSRRTEVTPAQLATLPRGEPWLSAPLVKVGDPIFVPAWNGSAAQPTLLRVQSTVDLQLLGVEGPAYQSLVLSQGAWEQRQGTKLDALTRGELPALAPGGQWPAAPGWTPFTSAGGGFAVWIPSFALPVPAPLPPAVPSPAPSAGQGDQTPPGLPPSVRDNLPTDPHLVAFGGFFDTVAVFYLAGSATLPPSAQQQLALLGPDAAFELIRDQMAKSDRIKLLDYHSITQGTYRGREVVLEPVQPENDPFAGLPGVPGLGALPIVPGGPGSASITLRVFLVGEKLYAIGAVSTPSASPLGTSGVAADVSRFLDSFRFLPS